MLREKLKTTLLIMTCVVAGLGLVATIIGATQYKGGMVAYELFQGLMQTCAFACVPAGFYAILVGQDMAMRHQGVPMPQPAPRPQFNGYAPQQPPQQQPMQQAPYQQPYQQQSPNGGFHQ